MRKRITLQDKKILIYEIHQGWAREHLEELTEGLRSFYKFIEEYPTFDGSSRFNDLKEEIKLQLRLLEFSTRKLEPEFFGKQKKKE